MAMDPTGAMSQEAIRWLLFCLASAFAHEGPDAFSLPAPPPASGLMAAQTVSAQPERQPAQSDGLCAREGVLCCVISQGCNFKG